MQHNKKRRSSIDLDIPNYKVLSSDDKSFGKVGFNKS